MSIELLKDRLPDYARDLKLNLSSLAAEQLLSPRQRAGSFIAAALAANHAPTTQALLDACAGELTPEALNAVKIAASLMAMNNIHYRFRRARTLGAEQALATPRAQAASWKAAWRRHLVL